MNISFFNPLGSAWNRMTTSLFKPFDLAKWFAVGFTAFLAGLTDGPYHGGGSYKQGIKKWDFDEFLDTPYYIWEWMLDHAWWLIIIIFGISIITVLIVLFTWLSSRGKFMFLDNVVHNKAEVIKPWNEYRKLGNSLFVWRLIFGFICIGLFLTSVVGFIFALKFYHTAFEPIYPVLTIVGIVFAFLGTLILIMYINSFLNNFVVPIMYKNQIKVLEGWHQFLKLFRKNPLHFILFGIIMFVLHIGMFILVILAGLFTCCIGFIFLAIPYISSLILLPFSYTFRAFGVEFLEQFGPEYKIFPKTKKVK